ncbi:hypothetical protein OAF74_02010 [bacterium]|jgi:hypothetical protein|nr:hypothetical protein [Planctomicrobium sp.]MDB4731592.1 hypothetical protein [bacterium]
MNKLRFRSGQVQLRKVRVNSNTTIEAGDLVWLDGNVARPAADFAWDTDLETTQADFAAKFLGIAHQPSGVGDSLPISVDISPDSVYEFDCSPGTYELGQPVGLDENLSSLMNQQCEGALAENSIARSAEFTNGTVSTIRITLASAFNTSSTNVNAALA